MELPELTALLTYRLNGPVETFVRAAENLAARVKADGHPGVLTYRFFSADDVSPVRALVDYQDADAWIGHHDIVMDWPEMAALRHAATLTGITFLGGASTEMLNWLAASDLKAKIYHGSELAAGFVRE